MSNWIDYSLDVLAGSPAEINQIAERLNQTSLELFTSCPILCNFQCPCRQLLAGLGNLLRPNSDNALEYQ